MLSLNRLSALLIIVALGLISFFALPWPTRSMTIAGRDVNISGRMLVAAAVLGLVATGAQAMTGAERDQDPCCVPSQRAFWILPTLVSAVALVVLGKPREVSTQLIICSATVATLVLLILAEHYSLDSRFRLRMAPRTVVEVAAFSFMTLLMTALKMEQTSNTQLSQIAGLCGVAVSYVVFSEELVSPRRALLCAVASGLVAAIVAGIVGPVMGTPAAYGLVQTITLYVSVGLLRGYLRGQLRRVVVVEYLLVAGVGLLIVLVSGR